MSQTEIGRVTITTSNRSAGKTCCCQCEKVTAAIDYVRVARMPDRSGWYCSHCVNLLRQLLNERGIEPQEREKSVLIKKGSA